MRGTSEESVISVLPLNYEALTGLDWSRTSTAPFAEEFCVCALFGCPTNRCERSDSDRHLPWFEHGASASWATLAY